jgi:predicted ATPase/class 3 adenylate cyclase
VRSDLPTGTVTFLFTDVEGSTRLLHELGAEAYADELAEHRRIVRTACAREGGVEVDTQGDAFFFAFSSAPGAVAAAQAMTDGLADGRIRLRIGLHTGSPLVTGEGYVGDDVHLAARVAACGHGGQVLISNATHALVDGLSLIDLGEHRLKDIEEAVPIYQLGDKTFPPLRTISNTNLPRPASSFVGRERELEEVLAELRDGARLVTLTGPGGSGKTRLALEAAAELVSAYSAGIFWVGLASLRDPSLVTETISQALGARDGLVEHIGTREMLLLLDNLEQVIEAASDLSALLAACPRLALLVTSRELLRVEGEVEYAVPPLTPADAVSLFCGRSRLDPSAEIAELCDRLDDLPLAVELAAARTKVLSPTQILERLSERLDLLRGRRDADPRQQTLRATIAWSYDLLAEEERRLFRALSVFAGGCTLEAAEQVAEADLDTLQSLVEKSLLRFAAERYWMLETIREFAGDRLDEVGERAAVARRHARFYREALEERHAEIFGPRRGEYLTWFDGEDDNLRRMLDHLSETEVEDAARAAHLLTRFWVPRGGYAEAQRRLQALLAEDLSPATRGPVLTSLGEVEEWLGHVDAAGAAAEEAALLGEATGQAQVVADALRELAWVAFLRGEREEAVAIEKRALDVAATVDERRHLVALHDLGLFQAYAGLKDEARHTLRCAADRARIIGDAGVESDAHANLALLDLYARDFGSAYQGFRSALASHHAIERHSKPSGLVGFGWAALGLDRRQEARNAFGEAVDLLVDASMTSTYDFARAITGTALAAEAAEPRLAARLRGAGARLDEVGEFTLPPEDRELDRYFERPLLDALGAETYEEEHVRGETLSLEDTIDLARSLTRAARLLPPALSENSAGPASV